MVNWDFMTTVYTFTNNQRLLDFVHSNLWRIRAALFISEIKFMKGWRLVTQT